MRSHRMSRRMSMAVVVAAVSGAAWAQSPPAPPVPSLPVAMPTARVTLSGTSNVRNYSAWTDTVRVTQVRLNVPVSSETFLDDILKPGAVDRFAIEIPVGTLASREPGLDQDMYKALKGEANRNIGFRLATLEAGPTGALMAVGKLAVAGVERDVVFALRTQRRDGTLVVTGRLPLLMTDFGITPPTAMLGILKTDPKVIVTFEVILSGPGTT